MKLEIKDEDENGVGFMGGHIQGFHKFTRTIDGSVGIIYCDGNNNFVELDPDEITWNESKTEFDTKGKIKNMIISKNEVI